ncbi:hypothetical protein DSO57_1030348 [Entomophthora muscae]|uniref:Uncharacterized protein n=1 Tax=Entomophthora muscae TaxID=34485 RepID=A0ACC2TN22_9FUNG|nr:hypothetical protein DSO57_1030348 [Entomophthora muscae]
MELFFGYAFLYLSVYGKPGYLCNDTSSFYQVIQTGENPPCKWYRLPKLGHWVSNLPFQHYHSIPHAYPHGEHCITSGDVRNCTRELNRSIFVEQTKATFQRLPYFFTYEFNLTTLGQKGRFIDINQVSKMPLVDFDKLPFVRDTECQGSNINFAIGIQFSIVTMKQYNIYLQITIRNKLYQKSRLLSNKAKKVKFRSILETGQCDSYVAR